MKKLYLIIFIFTLLLFGSELQAQWVQTNGPEGGYVRCMISNGSDVYASVLGGGMYHSSDNGQSWTPINNGLRLDWDTTRFADIMALAISDNNIIAVSWQDAGIYISSNNGQSWKSPANVGLSSTYVQALAVKGDSILAGTYDSGIFISINDGENWTTMNNGLTNKDVYSITFAGSTIFAGTYQGVFRSTDNGQSWSSTNNGITGSEVRTMTTNGTTVFAGTYQGVLRSTDNGQNWLNVNSGLTSPGIFYLTCNDNKVYAGLYTMYGQNPDTTYKNGIFVSSDNGDSWSDLDTALSSNVNCISVIGTDIYVGTDGEGIFHSPDSGQNWAPINSGIKNTSITAFAVDGYNFFAGTSGGGIFLSTDKGQNWTSLNSGLTNTNITALVIQGEYLFAGTSGGGIFKSSDSGKSWAPVNSGIDNKWITSLAVNGNNIYAGAYNYELKTGSLYLSTNNGLSWGKISTGMINDNVYSLAIMGDYIFVGTYGGGVYLSKNNGQSWSEVNNGLTDTTIYSLTVKSNNIFAGTWHKGIFISEDTGKTWTNVDTAVGLEAVKSVAILGDSIFTGNNFSSRISLTTDNGKSWAEIDSGLILPLGIGALKIYNGSIFAGIYHGGAWTCSLSDLKKIPTPPVVGTITQPTCSVVTGSVILNGLPVTAMHWTINPGGITGGASSTTISGLKPGTYKFTITNDAGYTSDSSADVVINAQPATPDAPAVGTIIQPTCSVATGSVVLKGLPSGNWTPDSITGSADSTTISGLSAGTYNYTVTNDAGCTSDASADVVINAQPETPAAPIISLLNDTTLHSNTSTGNQWYNQKGLLSGDTTQDYIAQTSGDYYAIVTLNGCSSDTSNVITVVISGITLYGNQKTIKIYPSPFTKELIIENKGIPGNINFEILNATGQIVFKGSYTDKTRISTSGFAPGVYIIIFKRKDNVEFHKAIKN